MPSILFVFTSVTETLTGAQSGWYLPEAAHPYYILAPHASIDFASPKGGNPPLDPGSVKLFENDPDSIKFLADETVKAKLAACAKLSTISVKDYDAIFYIGGHGPVIDLAVDNVNIKLASEFYQAGKIVSAVCHGPAAIVGATDAQGKSIFAGKSVTGFSNAEEVILGKVKDVPFALEDRLVSLGATYTKAAEAFGPHVVVDGTLYTGQNPASSVPLAEAILKGLQK
ncbi:class I glutamine amidotransferase-like protein [Mycena filopes]|nr:class I glutamine amidotransferase-like protein [Mycena filopes]